MKFRGLEHTAGGSLRLIALLFCALIVIGSLASGAPAAVSVKLDVATTPDNGLVGGNVNITGSGFPSETITPHNVSISLATTCGGSNGATVLATSVIDIIGTSKRINFVIPSSLQQGTYFAAISDSTDSIPFASGNCSEVKVSVTRTLTSITITPADPSGAKNTPIQLHAIGSFSDGTTSDLTTSRTTSWTSSVESVATVVSGSSGSGQVTGVSVGSSTITANQGEVSGSTTVTVTPAILTSIAITPANLSLPCCNPAQLSAIGSFSDGTKQDLSKSVDISWTSSSADVATVVVGPVAGGQLTPGGVGSATITASQDGVSGIATVTVTPAILTSIAITPANPSIPKDTTVQLRANGGFSDGTSKDETTSASWTSSDPTIAEVNNAGNPPGLVLGGPKLGSATITATVVGVPESTTPTTVTGSTTVTVTPVITITPANPSITVNTSQQLQALEALPDGTTQDVTSSASWTSSDSTIASVVSGALGFSHSGLVSGANVGSVTIKATSQDGVSGSTTVTVKSAVLTSISICAGPSCPNAADPFLCFNQTETLQATGVFSNNTTQDLGSNTIDWASSSPGIVTVGCGPSGPFILGPCPSSASSGTDTSVLTANNRGRTDLTIECVVTSCTPSVPAGVVTSGNVGGSATITATQNTANGSVSGQITLLVDNSLSKCRPPPPPPSGPLPTPTPIPLH